MTEKISIFPFFLNLTVVFSGAWILFKQFEKVSQVLTRRYKWDGEGVSEQAGWNYEPDLISPWNWHRNDDDVEFATLWILTERGGRTTHRDLLIPLRRSSMFDLSISRVSFCLCWGSGAKTGWEQREETIFEIFHLDIWMSGRPVNHSQPSQGFAKHLATSNRL